MATCRSRNTGIAEHSFDTLTKPVIATITDATTLQGDNTTCTTIIAFLGGEHGAWHTCSRWWANRAGVACNGGDRLAITVIAAITDATRYGYNCAALARWAGAGIGIG